MWWVHNGPLYMHSNEWTLLNNNSLILLKLRGTHPGGECLPKQTLHWSLENVLRSLPYCGLEGTLQEHGLSPSYYLQMFLWRHSLSVMLGLQRNSDDIG